MPLPDGPMIASSGASASRPTSSSTSRSRPKKNSASAVSNGASPLNGQTLAQRQVRPAAIVAGDVQRGVLDEDRPLELLQLDARLEPELVVQERPRLPVDLEPLGLPAAPVEREHQLRAEALAVRMLGGERLELRDERELAAERELGVDPLLDRRQTQLLEALHLDARERLELEVGERPSLPQALGGAQRLRRGGRIAGCERLAPRRDEPFEVLEVELARLDPEQVAGSAGNEPRLAAVAGASTLRSRETWLRSAWSAEFTLCSAKSSPISRSRETTRFALSRSSASSARCFGPPIGTEVPSTRTVSGPRIRNSRRLAAIAPQSVLHPCPRSTRAVTPLGQVWDNAAGRSPGRCSTPPSASGPV